MTELSSLVAWSVCTEPGDESAGMLREALGNERSIALVREGSSGVILREIERSQLVQAANARFGDLSRTVEDSLARWSPRLKTNQIDKLNAEVGNGRWKVLTPENAQWPSSLLDLGWGMPALIWLRGQKSAIGKLGMAVSVVGSRTATSYGEWVTTDLVGGIAERGFSVVSGGAYGIDAIAHRSAIAMQANTVAVMAGGVDRIYPSGNHDLLLKVASEGAVISELPPGSSPTKWRFLQRNRLIAALGQATVVVEAGWRSGSINTAGHASALNRAVCAYPGAVTSPASAGCHRLIREQGAELVTSAEEVFECLGYGAKPTEYQGDRSQVALSGLGELEKRALDALTSNFRSLSTICTNAGLTPTEAKIALAGLQLEALAEASYSGWRRKGSNL